MVKVLPLIDAGPDTTPKLTGSPEEALALRANGALPKDLSVKAAKVMVWFARAISNDRVRTAAV